MTTERPETLACLLAGWGPNPSDGQVTWCGKPFDDDPRSTHVALPTRHNLLVAPVCAACLTALYAAVSPHVWPRPAVSPPPQRFALYGGSGSITQTEVWDALDRIRYKHPGLAVVTRGTTEGVDAHAEAWARARGVPYEGRPGWRKVASLLPLAGAVAFPGGRKTAALRDQFEAVGVPVWTPQTEP